MSLLADFLIVGILGGMGYGAMVVAQSGGLSKILSSLVNGEIADLNTAISEGAAAVQEALHISAEEPALITTTSPEDYDGDSEYSWWEELLSYSSNLFMSMTSMF